MALETIVLAGGRGTRLGGVLPDGVPKPLAHVAGRPFLYWLLERLARGGTERVILSTGWLADAVVAAVGTRFAGLEVLYSREDSPLGTGGAIRRALRLVSGPAALVLNGDTFLELDYSAIAAAHASGGSALTIACVEVPDVGRYGRVELRGDTVTALQEKAASGAGLINGGAYVADRGLLESVPAERFSFEQDFLAPELARIRPRAFRVRGAFIDIGVPADLQRAAAVLASADAKR